MNNKEELKLCLDTQADTNNFIYLPTAALPKTEICNVCESKDAVACNMQLFLNVCSEECQDKFLEYLDEALADQA